MFQCYSTVCLQIWATLSQDQRETKYCSHLKDANYALEKKVFAEEHLVKLEDLSKLKLSESDLLKFQEASSDEKISVFSAPGDNLIVPSLSEVSHICPLPFVHIRKKICPLPACKGKKSKLHSLGKKDEVLCEHSLLGKSKIWVRCFCPTPTKVFSQKTRIDPTK